MKRIVKFGLLVLALLGYALLAVFGSIWVIDLLFAFTALGGALFTMFNIKESWDAWRLLKNNDASATDQDYNPRLLVSLNSLRSELARLFIQVIFVSIGIYALFLPSVSAVIAYPLYITIFQYLFRWGLIASSLVLTVKSYWGFQLRRRVLDHYRKIEDKDG